MELLLFNKQTKKRHERTGVQGMAVFLDVLVQGEGSGAFIYMSYGYTEL